jgi:vancomycin resistance protein YoaR
MLKLRKGTLATQIAAARSAGGDAFGNDSSVWDKFKRAEERIDQEAIESEVDAAMRGDVAETALLDRKLAEAEKTAGLLGDGSDPLAALKSKMAADKAAKQPKQIAAPATEAKREDSKPVDDAHRPEVKVDQDKLEAELAAMRAAMKSDK